MLFVKLETKAGNCSQVVKVSKPVQWRKFSRKRFRLHRVLMSSSVGTKIFLVPASAFHGIAGCVTHFICRSYIEQSEIMWRQTCAPGSLCSNLSALWFLKDQNDLHDINKLIILIMSITQITVPTTYMQIISQTINMGYFNNLDSIFW